MSSILGAPSETVSAIHPAQQHAGVRVGKPHALGFHALRDRQADVGIDQWPWVIRKNHRRAKPISRPTASMPSISKWTEASWRHEQTSFRRPQRSGNEADSRSPLWGQSRISSAQWAKTRSAWRSIPPSPERTATLSAQRRNSPRPPPGRASRALRRPDLANDSPLQLGPLSLPACRARCGRSDRENCGRGRSRRGRGRGGDRLDRRGDPSPGADRYEASSDRAVPLRPAVDSPG